MCLVEGERCFTLDGVLVSDAGVLRSFVGTLFSCGALC